MTEEPDHVVHLGLYSDKAKAIVSDCLQSIFSNWDTVEMHEVISSLEVTTQNDGEVIIVQKRAPLYGSNPIGRPNNQVIKWLAFCIKRLVTWYFIDPVTNKSIAWSNSSKKMQAGDVKGHLRKYTVGEIMLLHAVLKRKVHFRDKADEAFARSLVGKKRDPITTEMLNSRDRELEELVQWAEKEKKRIRDDADLKKQELYNKFRDIDLKATDDVLKIDHELQKKTLETKSKYDELIKPFLQLDRNDMMSSQQMKEGDY